METPEKDQKRFWSKVALPNEQGCMLWTAYVDSYGYGRFGLAGKAVRVHRFSYELAYGEIPDGLVIDHVKANGCTNKHCVAPLHLEAVTSAENSLRGIAGAAKRAQTHCKQGHPYDETNTYVCSQGKRKCRTCDRERHRRAARPTAEARSD